MRHSLYQRAGQADRGPSYSYGLAALGPSARHSARAAAGGGAGMHGGDAPHVSATGDAPGGNNSTTTAQHNPSKGRTSPPVCSCSSLDECDWCNVLAECDWCNVLLRGLRSPFAPARAGERVDARQFISPPGRMAASATSIMAMEGVIAMVR